MIKQEQRIKFDITNKDHVQLFKRFNATKSWGSGGCPFELEWPFLSVPAMIQSIILQEYLKKE